MAEARVTNDIHVQRKESHIRSVLKACSWRVLATLTTMVISFFITGSLRFAVSIGALEMVSKLILYYFHERAWARLKV